MARTRIKTKTKTFSTCRQPATGLTIGLRYDTVCANANNTKIQVINDSGENQWYDRSLFANNESVSGEWTGT